MSTLVYSIGHSSRPAESFLGLLRHYDIACVVDVRRYPGSRRHPHFNRGTLETSLNDAHIEYVHLGESLGGYRDIDYQEYQESDAFAAGLVELEKHAARTRCAFMCAEKVPWQCHRRFIAEALFERDFKVHHILDEETIWDPKELFLGGIIPKLLERSESMKRWLVGVLFANFVLTAAIPEGVGSDRRF